MGQPLIVNYRGCQYLRAGVTKLGAAVNLAVYDPTHEVEAQKWVADQLRKKRRVWRDLAEQMDFVLFSSDIPDAQKAVFAIRQKFDKMFETPVKLIELVDAEQLATHPPAAEKPPVPAAPPVPATAPGADAARKQAAIPSAAIGRLKKGDRVRFKKYQVEYAAGEFVDITGMTGVIDDIDDAMVTIKLDKKVPQLPASWFNTVDFYRYVSGFEPTRKNDDVARLTQYVEKIK